MTEKGTTSVTQQPVVTLVTTQGTIGQDRVQVDDDRDDDLGYCDGDSYAPNDHEEQERMDLGHHIYRLLLNGELFLAPISSNPQRVLDLGTGTGIWAMDFADQYPSAEVLGTDLSPIQPKWTPPNCAFEVDDFEEEWMFRKKFDYIHARELEGCVSNPDQLFRRAYEHLAPGGWFEMQAVCSSLRSDDGTGDSAESAQMWMKSICDGARKFGKPLDSAPEWKEKMKVAGFIDVQQDIRKEIGKFQYIQEQQAIDSYTPGIFSSVLGWKDEEIKVLITKVKKDIKNPEYHLYIPVYFIWGRKP
ncbi:umta methyltransferase family protein [Grosmannia clavigera kw1407]|uniref:Umta methyltransferase family protein n=1 Tax=Grosmannia clavigera (strain kw1407 / UAMH 11150) TaxID=655863 RepID=F0XI98_GROCL|nr:umta methyltransferase family protein [Grosmannia clavigera kw1407]EFX02618.1 umta methyltransferase family protein [Grosmannia clavigera kw1407]